MSETTSVEWHLAVKAGAVAEGEAKQVEIKGQLIAVCNIGGTYYAISDVCTHEFACFTDGFIDGEEVECPLHQARFHIPTGKVRCAPATEDVRTFPVKREGDDIFVGIGAG